jgi:hypothetical protein
MVAPTTKSLHDHDGTGGETLVRLTSGASDVHVTRETARDA